MKCYCLVFLLCNCSQLSALMLLTYLVVQVTEMHTCGRFILVSLEDIFHSGSF